MEDSIKKIKAAKRAVYRALEAGQITKTPCVQCGSENNLRQTHKDYSKPLEVEWVCSDCLKKRRSKERQEYEAWVRRILKDDRDNWNRFHYGSADSGKGKN